MAAVTATASQGPTLSLTQGQRWKSGLDLCREHVSVSMSQSIGLSVSVQGFRNLGILGIQVLGIL